MESRDRERVVVVLVRARNPSNIGAVARAMHDFGYTTLRVVNEYPVPFAAAKSAVDASLVLDAAGQYSNLAEALHDCTLALGTTAVGERKLEHPLYDLQAASSVVSDALCRSSDAKVALLFGSEKTGLSNDELSYCHALVTIPMNAPASSTGQPRHLSMNLGQAAAVCLYSLLPQPVPLPIQTDPVADGSDLERITNLLNEVLEHSGYARRNPANARPAATRRLIRRLNPTTADAAVWTGILRQTLHRLKSGPQPGETP